MKCMCRDSVCGLSDLATVRFEQAAQQSREGSGKLGLTEHLLAAQRRRGGGVERGLCGWKGDIKRVGGCRARFSVVFHVAVAADLAIPRRFYEETLKPF